MLKEKYSTDYVKLKEMQDEIQKINQEIEEKMTEWAVFGDTSLKHLKDVFGDRSLKHQKDVFRDTLF